MVEGIETEVIMSKRIPLVMLMRGEADGDAAGTREIKGVANAAHPFAKEWSYVTSNVALRTRGRVRMVDNGTESVRNKVLKTLGHYLL